jgi:hypothetical protein
MEHIPPSSGLDFYYTTFRFARQTYGPVVHKDGGKPEQIQVQSSSSYSSRMGESPFAFPQLKTVLA